MEGGNGGATAVPIEIAILLEMVARAARTSTISVSVRCNIGSKEMTCTVDTSDIGVGGWSGGGNNVKLKWHAVVTLQKREQ